MKVDQIRFAYSLFHETPRSRPGFFNFLLCSETTTREEISLFTARIAQSPHPGLYAILYIETLDSGESQHLERALFALAAAKDRPHFAVVLFCSSEAYETSHLAGLLSRYRRSAADEKWALTQHCLRQHVVTSLAVKSAPSNVAVKALEDYKAVLVTSVGYGQGKSLAIRRFKRNLTTAHKIVVHKRQISLGELWRELMDRVQTSVPKAVHLDMSDHRTEGVDRLLFQLLVLGGFSTPDGKVWRWRPSEAYILEITSAANRLLALRQPDADHEPQPAWTGLRSASEFRFCLPIVQCHGPAASLHLLLQRKVGNPELMHRALDGPFIRSVEARRCAYYIRHGGSAAAFDETAEDDGEEADRAGRLESLLKEMGVETPSWLELRNFVAFLNRQLAACEENTFCVSGELRGFTALVVFFSLEMARDFATRSLRISEEVTKLDSADAGLLSQLQQYSVKHGWEQSPHPYLFFNPDMQTFSFFGCNFQVEGRRVNLADPKTGAVLKAGLMDRGLFDLLEAQLQPLRSERGRGLESELRQPFDRLTREEKLRKLYHVLIPDAHRALDLVAPRLPDPDPNYELTMDCVLKMLAIEMRMRFSSLLLLHWPRLDWTM